MQAQFKSKKTQIKTSCRENEPMSLKINNTFLINYYSHTISTVWLIYFAMPIKDNIWIIW